MVYVFGIKNCNSMKKAFDWLDTQHIEYTFHDYKKLGISPEVLTRWCSRCAWQTLLNTKGTTWRGLNDSERKDVDQAKAIALMSQYTSLIKRPVIEAGDALLVGFDADLYAKTLC